MTTDDVARPEGAAATIDAVMAWRRFLNNMVFDPAWIPDLEPNDAELAMLADENRRRAAEGRAIGYFTPGTPLDTDAQLVAAWRAMRTGWHGLLEALPDGCRLPQVLERFLTERGHEPRAAGHEPLVRLGREAGLGPDASALEVVVAHLAATQDRAQLAARGVPG